MAVNIQDPEFERVLNLLTNRTPAQAPQGPSLLKTISIPETKTVTEIQEPAPVEALRREIEEEEKKMAALGYSPTGEKIGDIEAPEGPSGELPKTTALYAKMLEGLQAKRSALEEPEKEATWKDWAKGLSIALGPAILGAALGRDALGRAMGATAGATASKEYAEAMEKKAESQRKARLETLQDLRKQEGDLTRDLIKSMADAELIPQKAAAAMSEEYIKAKVIPVLDSYRSKGGKLPPMVQISMNKLDELNKRLGGQLATPGKKITTTREEGKPESKVLSYIGKPSTKLNVPPEAIKPSDVVEVKKVAAQFYPIVSALDEYEKVIRATKGAAKPYTELDAKARALFQELLLRSKEYYNLGVLQPVDVETLTALIPRTVLEADAGKIVDKALEQGFTPDRAAQSARTLKEIFAKSYKERIQPYGYTYVPMEKARLTPEQIQKLKQIRGQ